MNRSPHHLLGLPIALVSILLSAWLIPATVFAQDDAMRQLSIEEAYRIALRRNEQISAARQRLNQEEAAVKIARSPLLPQVNLNAQSTRQKKTGFGNFFLQDYNQFSVRASQSIYQGGKLWSNYNASQFSAQGQAFQFYRTRQQILYAVAQSFYNVLFARRSIEIGENQVTRAQRQLQLAKQRQEVGLVDQTAVLRAQVQVAAAKETLERARNQYTVATERLALEMGVPQPPASVQEPMAMDFELKPMAQYLERAFGKRHDLMAAEQSVKAAREQVDAQKADYIPDFSLQGSYSRADKIEVFYSDYDFWQVDLVASYPLFTGFRRSAQVARAEAAEAEARAVANRLKQQIRLDVRSAYTDIQTRKRVITNLKDQVTSARANYQQVTAQFREGLASSVDIVDAETALNEAERRLAITHYLYQLDQLKLQLASGTFADALLQPVD